MDFKSYYEKVAKTFKFRIKAAFELTDNVLDVIETVLYKYRPVDIGSPEKLMFQTTPLSFTGVKNVELYILDVELSVPTSPTMLQYDLRTAFGWHQDSDLIQVFEEGSHPQEELLAQREAQEEALKDGPLLTQPDYPEAAEVNVEDHYGDAYNAKFLDYIKKVEEQRMDRQKTEGPMSITQWEKQIPLEDAEPKLNLDDFNAGKK